MLCKRLRIIIRSSSCCVDLNLFHEAQMEVYRNSDFLFKGKKRQAVIECRQVTIHINVCILNAKQHGNEKM